MELEPGLPGAGKHEETMKSNKTQKQKQAQDQNEYLRNEELATQGEWGDKRVITTDVFGTKQNRGDERLQA